ESRPSSSELNDAGRSPWRQLLPRCGSTVRLALQSHDLPLRCHPPSIHAGVTRRQVSVLSAGTLGGNEPFHRRTPALEQGDDAPQNAEGDDGSEGRGGDGQGRTGESEVRSGVHGQSPQRIGRKAWRCRAQVPPAEPIQSFSRLKRGLNLLKQQPLQRRWCRFVRVGASRRGFLDTALIAPYRFGRFELNPASR